MAMDTTPGTITVPQRDLITKLLDEKEHNMDAAVDTIKEHLGEMSKQSASDMITALFAYADKAGAPKASKKYDDMPDADALPTGHYAIDNADGELTFYRVWRGTRNPDYVKLYVEHGPDDSEIPFGKGMITILNAIAADPGAAAVRYGHEIGACSQCSKRLTNRVSRALGIGPICGGRFWGEEFKSVVHGAREQIKAQGLDPDGNVEEDEEVTRYDIVGDFNAPETCGYEFESGQNCDKALGHPGLCAQDAPAVTPERRKADTLWTTVKDATRAMSDEELDSYIALLTREQEKREVAKREQVQDQSFLAR